ncbi:hypothetical protein EXIGLDRAFT_756681 [Exidia glandulosa HHB12029]|uniref:Uncharacterized protein n=1 Tax=Exidia glandulosa HHB12029 TaxID=1314781 RepID=A0A165B594_EXIGL|nr:hypothetical protein EXIGLDRAFT_756681 [Exidia glandulosa HHB12029]
MIPLVAFFFVHLAHGHIGAYHRAMYCLNGLSNVTVQGIRSVSDPQQRVQTWDEFWFRGQCKEFPPPEGEFLELPVGGYAELELVGNKAVSSLGFSENLSAS